MADTKEIIVTLKVEGTDTEKEPSVDVGSPESDKTDSTAKATYKTMAVQAANIVIGEAVAWADYLWEKELILNDDYVGQREKRIALQYLNKSISYATAIASGAAMGSAAGPVGAVIGAVIAGIGVAAGTIRENQQAMDQQQIMINQMNAQLNFTRQRAGWSLEAASIGEDL